MKDNENNNSYEDVFRDTPVRFLGYTNEVGEAFRKIVPAKYVNLSYGISSTYCFADAIHKSMLTVQEGERTDTRKAGEAFVKAVVWQGLASVIIPGFTINRICWAIGNILQRMPVSIAAQQVLTTGVGLASIPFIIKPIDGMVDHTIEAFTAQEAHEVPATQRFNTFLDIKENFFEWW